MSLRKNRLHNTLRLTAVTLAAALAALIARPDRRMALGAAGLWRVRENFAMTAGIDRLAERFGARAATVTAAQ